jgi:hypothetical protein
MSFKRTEAQEGFALAARVPAASPQEAENHVTALKAYLATVDIAVGKDKGAFVHYINDGRWPVVNLTQDAYDTVQQALGKSAGQTR